MLQRILILYIAGILLCHFLLGPIGQEQSGQRQDVLVVSTTTGTTSVSQQLLSEAGLDSTTVSLAQALLLGDKHALPTSQKQLFREAGMSHLLAVSGLHIGIIWLVFSWLFRPLLFVVRWRWYLWLVLLILWGYIAMVGFPVSAVRAGVMITMMQISRFLQRDVWGWHNLYCAALLILLIAPSQLFEVGFQLSFMATAGIMAAAPRLQQKAPTRGVAMRIYWRVRQLLLLTLSAQLFTLPLVAYYFHSVPLFGWIQGILVVPIIAVLVYLLLAILLLASMGVAISPLSSCADALTWWIDFVARVTIYLEHLCVGGSLVWYPTLLETLFMLLAILILVALCVRSGGETPHSASSSSHT